MPSDEERKSKKKARKRVHPTLLLPTLILRILHRAAVFLEQSRSRSGSAESGQLASDSDSSSSQSSSSEDEQERKRRKKDEKKKKERKVWLSLSDALYYVAFVFERFFFSLVRAGKKGKEGKEKETKKR